MTGRPRKSPSAIVSPAGDVPDSAGAGSRAETEAGGSVLVVDGCVGVVCSSELPQPAAITTTSSARAVDRIGSTVALAEEALVRISPTQKLWRGRAGADRCVVHRLVASALATLALVGASAASARTAAPPFAAAEIAKVVDAGLMAPSVESFRPQDPLTASELAIVIASLGGAISIDDPDALVTVRELDARLVSLAGLRPAAQSVRLAAVDSGLDPRPWLGTETVARMLGLRINHPRTQDRLELQVSQPVTRAEAAYSFAVYLELEPAAVDAVRVEAERLAFPALTAWQRIVVTRALRFVGSPYVWAGTSERPQALFGTTLPGGFDCSGFVWRVYKLQAFTAAPELSRVLKGRTSYAMSGEVPRSARIPLEELQPADVVFFGERGPRSAPNEVGHMGIYVGNGWFVHSSRFGTTLTSLTGWYEKTFAWGRSPLLEAGLEY